jgi:hypothetical protein
MGKWTGLRRHNRRKYLPLHLVETLNELLNELPQVAKSPLAFVAYLVMVAAWVVISLKVVRNWHYYDTSACFQRKTDCGRSNARWIQGRTTIGLPTLYSLAMLWDAAFSTLSTLPATE